MQTTTVTNSTTEPRFNLSVEPWIPVVWRDGRREPERVSLRDAFACGTEILDLAGRPHERVSLLRLLICFAQTALSGPTTRTGWRNLGPPKDGTFADLKGKVLAYLALHGGDREAGKFWLFHPSQPFLQVAGLTAPKKARKQKTASVEEDDEDGPLSAEKKVGLLELRFARDQAGGTTRIFSDAELAVMLLGYLNFAPGQPEGVALWDGRETLRKGGKPAKGGKCHASDCPCTVESAVHVFVVGQCLLETVWLNLVPADELNRIGFRNSQLGRPVWELESDVIRAQTQLTGRTPGYLERLVPLSRLVKLNPNGQAMVLSNGVEYSPFLLDERGKRVCIHMRPPSTAFTKRKVTMQGKEKEVDEFVSAEPGKALWRVLHVLAFLHDGERGKAPVALSNLEDLQLHTSHSRVKLHAVALLTNQAKLEDFVESVFECRSGLLLNEPAFNDYAAGLKHAEVESERLGKATARYFKALKEQQRISDLKRAAVQDFWNVLEQESSVLLQLLDANLGLDGRYPTGQIDFGKRDNPWGQRVWAASRAAFRRACPCLNARQIIAYAEGLKELDRKTSKRSKKP